MDQSAQSNTMMSGYMEATLRSWNDAEYKRRLADDPAAALAEVGWNVPAGTAVEVSFFDPGELAGSEQKSADELTTGWASSIAQGNLSLSISDRHPDELETTEVSEDELANVSAGHCAEPYCVMSGL
jgi:hypothetical protein